MLNKLQTALFFLLFLISSLATSFGASYDVIIRGGRVYDGTGTMPRQADIAIKGEIIAQIGNLEGTTARKEIDAQGMAVAPGFINMLSWATESLIQDGNSQSDIRQGVTLEIFGEGNSMGPLTDKMKKVMVAEQGDIKFDIKWTTLAEYLDYLTEKGISCNVGSFIGATSVRVHEVDYADRAPTAEELTRMKGLVRVAMEDGALGVGSSLIYAPAFYAKTDELVELARVAGEYGGMYISHVRNEGNSLLEAADELIDISRRADVPAEFYHIKAAGKQNWGKLDQLLAKIEKARKSGLEISADMYTYLAAGTGLDATMPPWVQEGGLQEWIKRLKDPVIRQKVKAEMSSPATNWENFFLSAGSPDRILLSGFKNEKLKSLTGKTLAEVARLRQTTPQEAAMDMVVEDGSRVDTIYFLMSEENLRKELKTPWISFGSDEASLAPEGPFLKSNPHPRAYGNVARLLGRYVRDEKVLSLESAVRRLSGLPADHLRLDRRGYLRSGFFADIVIFDPDKIEDHATFDRPHQFSTGVREVFVNGTQVLAEGKHTGAKPGQVVRGPGWGLRQKVTPLGNVHAHNDYEHPRPLFDALDHGVCSVEADIHLVGGKLLVAHAMEAVLAEHTLEWLYLDPLRQRIRHNGGRVYPNGPECTLLIDLKTDWPSTYPVLRGVLEKYSDILSTFDGDIKHANAITVILTGDRSREMFAGEQKRLAAYDGSPAELNSEDGANVIPWISANWSKMFHWTGRGAMPDQERETLKKFVAAAHAHGRKVRFWGGPDNPAFWRGMLESGVDILNVDDLAGAQKFLLGQNPGPH
jgi:N-acyl-D-amino-acid deacylase